MPRPGGRSRPTSRGAWKRFAAAGCSVRRNLHLGVGFLAATSGADGPGRLRFRRVPTGAGAFSIVEAGEGPPVLMLHGLGGTKASFLPSIAALAPSFRTLAVDLLGFGDSDKPLGASYGPEYQARAVEGLLDALELDRAHIFGHSMGGRVALELGFLHPDRTDGLVLMTPAMAWLRERRWAPYLRWVRPELGLLQVAPRAAVEPLMRRFLPGADTSWGQSAIDEFVRVFTSPRGRAAFYAAARNIYLDEPHGEEGFWSRLRALAPEALFIWGLNDRLAPVAFIKHVEEALPAAEHVELDCGHLPQIERPRETHAAIARFLGRVGKGSRLAKTPAQGIGSALHAGTHPRVVTRGLAGERQCGLDAQWGATAAMRARHAEQAPGCSWPRRSASP